MLTVCAALVLTQAVDLLERCPQPLVASALRPSGEVRAPVSGVVKVVEPGRVEVSLCAFENHELLDVSLAVETNRSTLQVGQRLPAGAPLGRGKVTLDGVAPQRFFAQHPFLFDPHREPVLIVVDVDGHQAARYERGRRTHLWDVGRGQAEGPKGVRGDLKTPRGLYFVTEKSTGPFSGEVAAYYGGHWIKLNYPNAFDARRGVEAGLVTKTTADEVARRWWRRSLTAQSTKLGGGIGFHGWIAPWQGDVDGYGLSWGCVVMHPEDVHEFYALVPLTAAVILR